MLVQIDAKQLEWRVLAWLANDPVAIQEINSGVDFHSENQKLFGLPTRLIAKTYLFRTIYRGNGWSFAKDPNFRHVSTDPEYWDKINEKFYKKYQGINKWHLELARTVAKKQPICSPFGREWFIPMIEGGSLPWTVFTNYPVQGTGNDILAIGRISLYRRMRQLSMRSLLVSTVHDSIILDSPKNEILPIAKLALKVFDDITVNIERLFNIKTPVQFPGEVKVGTNLRDTEPLTIT